MAALPLAFILLLSVLAAVVVNMALRDFVAPLQITRNVGAKEAGGVFLSIFFANPGLLIGYALLKFALSIALGILMAIVCVVTCCIGVFPLVHQTLFQPIYYAERAWPLKLLAQMGEDAFAKFAPPAPRTPPPAFDDPGDAPTGPIDLSAIDFETPPEG